MLLNSSSAKLESIHNGALCFQGKKADLAAKLRFIRRDYTVDNDLGTTAVIATDDEDEDHASDNLTGIYSENALLRGLELKAETPNLVSGRPAPQLAKPGLSQKKRPD